MTPGDGCLSGHSRTTDDPFGLWLINRHSHRLIFSTGCRPGRPHTWKPANPVAPTSLYVLHERTAVLCGRGAAPRFFSSFFLFFSLSVPFLPPDPSVRLSPPSRPCDNSLFPSFFPFSTPRHLDASSLCLRFYTRYCLFRSIKAPSRGEGSEVSIDSLDARAWFQITRIESAASECQAHG